MSVSSELTKLNTNMQNAYTAVNNKGGTLPASQNMDNLATAIGSIPSGSTPVINTLNVTPTTSAQTITAPSGVDGYSPINVSAVTSSIDSNIVAGNIKDGVPILGIFGTYRGINPSGTYNITLNGTYNITNYANVYVNVPATITGYIEFPSYQVVNGVASKRSGALIGNEFSNITSVGENGLYYAFYNNKGLTGYLNLSSLTSIDDYGLYYTFYRCSGLTGVDLSSLTSVGSYGISYAFYYCSGLTSADLSLLTTVDSYGLYYTFYFCSGLTGNLDLSSLTRIGSYGLCFAFDYCSGITSVNLSSLTSVDRNGLVNAFYGCTSLTDIYFNSLTTTSFGSYINQFNAMLSSTGTSVTHTLHFPSNLESTIQGLTGYPTFGGTSGYVVLAFDLPATS